MEEEFVRDLIFKSKIISEKEIKLLNFEKLTVFCSEHLIIPLVFIKIRQKKILKYFPKDFLDYFNYIYEHNLERNKFLLKEVKILNKILTRNKIEHVFIKGAAMLIGNYYSDIGERMIGDLDFLIKDVDSVLTESVLQKNKYFKTSKNHFFSFRHLPRRFKDNLIFSIEPHVQLLSKKSKLLEPKSFFKNNKIIKGCKIPCNKDILLHNIYNIQINDYAYVKMFYSYKNMYDSYLAINKQRHNLVNNKYITQYFNYMHMTGIMDGKNDYYKFKRKFYFIKKNISILFKIYLNIFFGLKKLKFMPYQVLEFLNNKSYRRYIFKRFRKIKSYE